MICTKCIVFVLFLFFIIIGRRIYLYLILMMYVEVGPVRVLRPVFEEVVNNRFGLNLYSVRSLK